MARRKRYSAEFKRQLRRWREAVQEHGFKYGGKYFFKKWQILDRLRADH